MTSDGIAGVIVGTISLVVSLWIAARQRKDSVILGDLHTKVLNLQGAVALCASVREPQFLDIKNVGLQRITDVKVMTARLVVNDYDVISERPDAPRSRESLGPQEVLSVPVQAIRPLKVVVSFKDGDGKQQEATLYTSPLR